MGGNAALGNSIMAPEQYAACVDISGGIGLTPHTMTLKDELNSGLFKDFPLYLSTFGPADTLEGSRHDLAVFAKRNLEHGKKIPEYHIICGSKEFIRERVERDVRTLQEIGYHINYICAEGYDHNFDLWDEYLRITMEELLPLKRKPVYPVGSLG